MNIDHLVTLSIEGDVATLTDGHPRGKGTHRMRIVDRSRRADGLASVTVFDGCHGHEVVFVEADGRVIAVDDAAILTQEVASHA